LPILATKRVSLKLQKCIFHFFNKSGSERSKKAVEDTAKVSDTEKYAKTYKSMATVQKEASKTFAKLFCRQFYAKKGCFGRIILFSTLR
jgi:hypothetical protein